MTPAVLVVCKNCNQTFLCFRRRSYCSEACAAEARARRAGRKQSRPPTTTVECVSCGRRFRPRDPSDRFCSVRCQRQVCRDEVDRVRLVVEWVQSCCSGATSDDWCVVRLFFYEQRLLKVGEVAYSLRWSPDRVRVCLDRLAEAGVVSASDACEVEKYGLADVPGDPMETSG